MQLGLSLVQNPTQKIGWARLRELLMFLDLIWCGIQMYFGTVLVVWGVKKVLATLFPNIFHIKTKWKVVHDYLKTNTFSRYTNILPQMHRTSNIFGRSATTIRGFVVSLNYPILNFKKTVCLKNVWMLHWSHKTNIEKHSHNSAKTYILIIKISFWKLMIWFCYSFKKKCFLFCFECDP